MHNPYKNSLDGLVLEDPVQSFFEWCKEREAIRVKRENGYSYPWTDDVIFQKGRFLNTFREDDKGSKAVLHFCAPLKDSIPDLIHALFFARWCNHHESLNALKASMLKDPVGLKRTLEDRLSQPWYSSAYPVVSLSWKGIEYDRLHACTLLFPRIIDFLIDCISNAEGDVVLATQKINESFQMSNDFPIFMAVIDISLFQPNLIRPDSKVPTGIGAIPYLDRLQDFLGLSDHHSTALKMIELQKLYWPEARRTLTPVDIEYISCECRKYFSYKNGTKTFEGRNLFIPKPYE